MEVKDDGSMEGSCATQIRQSVDRRDRRSHHDRDPLILNGKLESCSNAVYRWCKAPSPQRYSIARVFMFPSTKWRGKLDTSLALLGIAQCT